MNWLKSAPTTIHGAGAMTFLIHLRFCWIWQSVSCILLIIWKWSTAAPFDAGAPDSSFLCYWFPASCIYCQISLSRCFGAAGRLEIPDFFFRNLVGCLHFAYSWVWWYFQTIRSLYLSDATKSWSSQAEIWHFLKEIQLSFIHRLTWRMLTISKFEKLFRQLLCLTDFLNCLIGILSDYFQSAIDGFSCSMLESIQIRRHLRFYPKHRVDFSGSMLLKSDYFSPHNYPLR